jgi:hypothetical protein
MKVWRLSTALAVSAGFILPVLLAPNPQDAVRTKLASDSQLQSVLLEAIDAVIAETHAEVGIDSRVETDLKLVTRYLLQTGNRADVLYLQQHSEKYYAGTIRGVLRPADTVEDFAERSQAAENETDIVIHDTDIELIIEQEIERGFLDDALREAKMLRMRVSQTMAMGDIALAAYKQGEVAKADITAAAAIERAASNEPTAELLDPQRMLIVLASTWHEQGYESAAVTARQEAYRLLQTDTRSFDSFWRDLGEAAAQQGDLKMAAQTMEHLSEPGARDDVQTAMHRTQARTASPEQALEIISGIQDDRSKFRALREIAVRQIDSGDKAGAVHTLQMAREAAERDDQFRALNMADIAWEQIAMGDKSAAEAAIAEGLKDNEKHRWGSDQVDGWMMLAEDLAQMGEYDRALEVARKIDYAPVRARALQLIAYHETQAGHANRAIVWAQTVEDPDGRAETFIGIAAGLIEHITGKIQDLN